LRNKYLEFFSGLKNPSPTAPSRPAAGPPISPLPAASGSARDGFGRIGKFGGEMVGERPDASCPAIVPTEDRLCGVPIRRNPSSRKLGKDVLPVARTVFVSIPPRDALARIFH
jgi:hypothetical protein